MHVPYRKLVNHDQKRGISRWQLVAIMRAKHCAPKTRRALGRSRGIHSRPLGGVATSAIAGGIVIRGTRIRIEFEVDLLAAAWNGRVLAFVRSSTAH